ncbi:MAG TPA: tail fiber assembly protein [Buttiauxella sp.]
MTDAQDTILADNQAISTAICFSASSMGFYPQAWIDDGTYADLPTDIITLTSDELIYRDSMPPAGKILGSQDGHPAWIDIPLPTSAELTAIAAQKKSALLAEASAIIAPLRDASDGGYIEDADKPKLVAWQKYRYDLMKVDPANPVWPQQPA